MNLFQKKLIKKLNEFLKNRRESIVGLEYHPIKYKEIYLSSKEYRINVDELEQITIFFNSFHKKEN